MPDVTDHDRAVTAATDALLDAARHRTDGIWPIQHTGLTHPRLGPYLDAVRTRTPTVDLDRLVVAAAHATAQAIDLGRAFVVIPVALDDIVRQAPVVNLGAFGLELEEVMGAACGASIEDQRGAVVVCTLPADHPRVDLGVAELPDKLAHGWAVMPGQRAFALTLGDHDLALDPEAAYLDPLDPRATASDDLGEVDVHHHRQPLGYAFMRAGEHPPHPDDDDVDHPWFDDDVGPW